VPIALDGRSDWAILLGQFVAEYRCTIDRYSQELCMRIHSVTKYSVSAVILANVPPKIGDLFSDKNGTLWVVREVSRKQIPPSLPGDRPGVWVPIGQWSLLLESNSAPKEPITGTSELTAITGIRIAGAEWEGIFDEQSVCTNRNCAFGTIKNTYSWMLKVSIKENKWEFLVGKLAPYPNYFEGGLFFEEGYFEEGSLGPSVTTPENHLTDLSEQIIQRNVDLFLERHKPEK
jgi:hypothetical protein